MNIDLFDGMTGKDTFFIYGTGMFARYCSDLIKRKYGKDSLRGFILTKPDREFFLGTKVLGIDDISKDDLSSYFIVSGFREPIVMKENLLKKNVDEGHILIPEGCEKYFNCTLPPNEIIKSICFWPPISGQDEDILDKIKWFVPPNVLTFVGGNNNLDSDGVIHFTEKNKYAIWNAVNFIYVWKEECIIDINEEFEHKIRNVDPNFYYLVEANNWRMVNFYSLSNTKKRKLRDLSARNLKNFMNYAKKYKRANVLCSGPSIQEVYGKEEEIKDDLNIICNSMVKDKRLLELIKPGMVCFGDFMFYLSPNRYCTAFYKDMVDGYHKYGWYLVVIDYEVPILLSHFPFLEDRILGLTPKGSDDIIIPTENQLEVKATDNICTLMMLPLAVSISDTIGIAGCTGREEGETYFWKHNERTQYHEFMQYVFDSYPSFFRDQSYDDYYDEHCTCMEKMIVQAESEGKKIVNLTTSFIPALVSRTVK